MAEHSDRYVQRERPLRRGKPLQRVLLFAAQIVLQFVLVPAVMPAATPSPEDKNAKLIRLLTDSLPAAPPEIEAHCLLRIADSGKASAVSAKALVETAFSLAGYAARPVQAYAAVPAALWMGDNEAGVKSSAGKQRVDALSLRCRAVHSMLRLSVPRAREMFDQIRLEVPAASCADALRPYPDIYYRTMLEVFTLAFGAREQEQGTDVEWFSAHTHINRAVQIAPVARALLKFRMDAERLGPLSGTLAAEIVDMRPDDRSFTATVSEAGPAVQEVGSALKGLGLSVHPLAAAWAGYLKRGLTAPRCQESVAGDGLQATKESVEAFNLTEAVWDPTLTKINFEELTSKVVLKERAEVRRYWVAPENEKMVNDYRALRFGTPEQRAVYASIKRPDNLLPFLPVEERRTNEWLAQALRHLRQLERWKEGLNETGLAQFAMVTDMYSGMLDLIPTDDPLFGVVLDSYIGLLGNSALKRDNPAVWLLRTSALIDRGFDGAQAPDFALIRAAIRKQGDTTLVALVGVRELTGR